MGRAAVFVAVIVAVFWGVAYGQGVLEPHPYMPHGVIEHHAGTATVKCNSGRPLEQAVIAVSEEYGWDVSYEDPPYQGTDLADMTSPKYRATHPNAPVVLGPAGGAFQSTFPDTPNTGISPTAEMDVLEKITADYNQSGNPGDFLVRELSDGGLDVRGTSTHDASGSEVFVKPVLDDLISIPSVPRTVQATFDAILNSLPVKVVSNGPPNLMMGGPITVGGNQVPARNLIMHVIDGWGGRWEWLLLYRPQDRTYVLNLVIATRVVYGLFGRRRLVPIGPTPGGP